VTGHFFLHIFTDRTVFFAIARTRIQFTPSKNIIMKLISTLAILLLTLNVFCQNKQLKGYIIKKDSLLDYKYLTITLDQGDTTIQRAIPDTKGYFSIKDIVAGSYRLSIQQIGTRDMVIDNLNIKNDTTIRLVYPPPCKFIYKNKKKVRCIKGHTNRIIPIVYGMPSEQMMKKAEKGLIHLGGCIVSDCDPHFYCTIHKKEL
jgi:hypothetical protein